VWTLSSFVAFIIEEKCEMFMKYKKTPPEKSGGAFSKGV